MGCFVAGPATDHPRPADPGALGGVRRAEVLAALSISIDLGLGLPMEHVLRSSMLASMLADELDLGADERATVYYTNLVLWIGCHADSHEFSRWFGDDLAMRRDSYELDWSGLPYLSYLLQRTGSDQPPVSRAVRRLTMLTTPRARMSALIHSHCLSAGLMADRIGLDPSVRDAVTCSFERWDGAGLPGGRKGEEIPRATRLVHLADVAEVHLRSHGTTGALAMARSRSGKQFDPAVVAALERCRDRLDALPDEDVWSLALAEAPDHDLLLTGEALDALLEAIGDFADLKCTFTVGHSRAVAELAAAAATRVGMPAADVDRVRRAGFVHDLGRMGVPNSVWDKAGALGEADRERIRMYPYLTGRILSRVRGLETEALIAKTHRERLDGSGYPGGLGGGALPMTQRVLAAADSYQGSREPRPHRPALTSEQAEARLRAEADAGRLDWSAVDAVLACSGHPSRGIPGGGPRQLTGRGGPTRRVAGPSGLTAREVEVLALVARGRSTAEVARELSISTKTARNHLEHVYLKAGVTNRVGAALFALEHGLLSMDKDGAAAP